MLFQKRIQRAFELSRQKRADRKSEDTDITLASEMEKGDLAAMIISAFIVIVPVALVVLLLMAGVAWLIVM